MILFTNPMNNCYINSVFQALINVHVFSNYFMHCTPNNGIMGLFQYILEQNTTISSTIVKKCLSEINQESFNFFGNNDQQDAHENMVKLLDIIHNHTHIQQDSIYNQVHLLPSVKSWETNINKFGYSMVVKYFTGQFKTSVVCSVCDYSSLSYDNFNNISLDIPAFESSVTDCIFSFIKKEKLLDAKCEKCNNKTLHKTTSIWTFPKVLIINLKRFGNFSKRYNAVISIDKNLIFSISKNKYRYKLVSTVNHHGIISNSGHYTADILVNDRWLRVDDDRYFPTNLEKSASVYILIYHQETF